MSTRGPCQIRCLVCVLLCATLLGSTSAAGGKLPGLTAGGAVLPQAQNVELVGQIGGWAEVFAVQGSYVYLGVGSQIEVLDVSNPAAPVKLSSYRGPGRTVADIEIGGHYAYVASDYAVDGNDLQILDISNPAALVKVGDFDTPQAILGLYVAGHHAYLAAGEADLRIVDISNPTAPREVGLYDVPYPARNVYVAGNYAYVGYGEIDVYASGNFCSTYGGLDVVDISDPSAPRQVGRYDARGGYIDNIQVSGSYAYVTGLWCSGKTAWQRSHLRVLDVSDPLTPLEVADYTIPRFMHSVCVVQDHAYVAAGSDGLRVLDVSNPAQPVEMGAWQTDADVSYACTIGPRTYVLVDGLGLVVLDVSNPSVPLRVGAYGVPTRVQAVEVAGRYAYVGGYHQALRVLDISNPAAPLQVGSLEARMDINDIRVMGNYAYLATWDGLHIVDISGPTNLREVGRSALSFYAKRLDVSGRYAYVLPSFPEELRVYDLSDPSAPSQMGVYTPTTGTMTNIDVVGRYAYVTIGTGLRVLDVSDPTQPTEVGALGGLGYVGDVCVAGGYAYLATWDGLQVVDVSDPTWPVPVGAFPQWGSAGVCVDGGYVYAFAAQGDPGTGPEGDKLVVLDLSDPAAPAEVGFFCPGVAHSLEAICCATPYVYVGEYHSGLMILRFALSTSAAIPPTGGSLISPADHTTYTFPPGAFSSTAVVTHTTRAPNSVPAMGSLVSIGHTGSVTASFSSSGQPAEPTQPYTLTVQYNEAERGPAIESSLALYFRQGTGWVKEPSSMVDAAHRTVTATTRRLGLWAILGDTRRVFLPVASKKNVSQ